MKKETCITEARLRLPSHAQGAHLTHAGVSRFNRLETSVYELVSDLCLRYAFSCVVNIVITEHSTKLSKSVYPPSTNKLYRVLIVWRVFGKEHSVQNGYIRV
jgi:hypothetical protein